MRAAEIEADFQRHYQIYLGDIFTGALPLRRFSVLLFGLPPGSNTWRAQGGELAWTLEAHAALLTRHAIQQFQSSFAKSPKEVPLPETPKWGHLEAEAEKRDMEMERAQARQNRIDKKIRERLEKYGDVFPS